jgi:hypothetical protein
VCDIPSLSAFNGSNPFPCINFNKIIKKVIKMECKKEENLKNCPCKSDCELKGICCECVKYHRENGGLPACLRS